MISRNAGAVFFLLAGACIEPRNSRIDVDSGGAAFPKDAGIGGNQPTASSPDGAAGGPDRGRGNAGGVDAAAEPDANLPQPSQGYNLTVTFQGLGRVVGDQAAPLSCSATCTRQFAAGTVVTLVAMGDLGAFIEWQGACVGTGSCRVTLTSDTSVTAVFRPYVTWNQGEANFASLAVAGDQIYVTGSLLPGLHDLGGISATGTNLSDGFLAKYDASGKIQWLKTFGSPGASRGVSVSASPTGDVVLTGMAAQGSQLDGMPLSPMFAQGTFIAWFSQAGQLQKLLTDTIIGPTVLDPSGNLVMA